MNAEARTMQRPLRWPLVSQASNRGESFLKDARLVNAFAEKDPNTDEYWVQKRIGYALNYTVAGAYLTGSGMYNWGQPGGGIRNLYSVFASGVNSTMYKDGVVFGAAGGLDLPFGTTLYRFVETRPVSAAAATFVFTSGLQVFYGGVGTWNVAPTPPHGVYVRGLAYLDQTIYFMDETGRIFGSGLNDPTTWTALNMIWANSIPGDGVMLTQQLNYVIALKTNSMEVFYDANNPVPGSPLGGVPQALSNYGCYTGDSVQVIDDVLFYLSSNRTQSPQVVRVDNLQIRIVSTPAIERLLDQGGGINSWTFKHGGHRFYGLDVAPYGSPANATVVFDIDQNLWYQWTSPTGGSFPFRATAIDGNNKHLIQGTSDGSVYLFEGDYTYPTDNGTVTPVDIYTPTTDFGTRRRKTLHRMYLRADQTPGSLLYVRRSEDDYQHWSNFRKVDLGRDTPLIDNEGTFVKRAYNFRHSSPTSFRIRSADLQMDFGTI